MNPDQTQNELTFEESVEEVMRTLPAPIRAYLSSGKYTQVALGLTRKYNLHIDQGGVLEKELALMLMGIETPEGFQKSLAEAAIPGDVVLALMTDINQEVFVPLRNQMQHPAQAARPAASLRPTPPKVAPGTPDYTGRMRIQTPPAPPAQIRPKPVAPAMPAVPQPMRASAAPQRAPLMDPERELPVGEGQSAAAPLPPKAALPRQNFQPRPAAPAPLQEPVAPRPRPVMPDPPAPRPNASAAPANLPGAFTPPPFPPRPPQTPTPPSISGGYGPADPYREPVE